MQSLVDKELVCKTETVRNGVKFCSYKAVCKNFIGCEKISHGGSEKISHNNIVNYNIQKETSKEKCDFVDEYIKSDSVKEAIKLWLDYKKERKDKKYTETGFRMLLGKLKKEVESYGDKYVIDEIKNSIEKGYMGIYPSKEYGKPKKQEFMHHNYSPEVLKDLDTERNWDDMLDQEEQKAQEPQSEIAKELAELEQKEFVNMGGYTIRVD